MVKTGQEFNSRAMEGQGKEWNFFGIFYFSERKNWYMYVRKANDDPLSS